MSIFRLLELAVLRVLVFLVEVVIGEHLLGFFLGGVESVLPLLPPNRRTILFADILDRLTQVPNVLASDGRVSGVNRAVIVEYVFKGYLLSTHLSLVMRAIFSVCSGLSGWLLSCPTSWLPSRLSNRLGCNFDRIFLGSVRDSFVFIFIFESNTLLTSLLSL